MTMSIIIQAVKHRKILDSFTVVRPAYLPANIPATTEDVSKQMIPDDDMIGDKIMKETNCLQMVVTISGRKMTCSTQQATVSHGVVLSLTELHSLTSCNPEKN